MQSIDDYKHVPQPPDDLFDIPDSMLDVLFYDLCYFPGYSPGDALENARELGDSDFNLQRQSFQPRGNNEGLNQVTIRNPVPYNESPHNTLLDTTWSNHKNQGQPTALATPPTPSCDPVAAAPTEHTPLVLPISPLSLSSPLITIASPEDESSLPQKRRRDKNRVAAARCRKKAKMKTGDLQQLGQELFQANKLLRAEAKDLRDEVLSLKKEIIVHGRCDSVVIQQYIQGAAALTGQGTSSRNESERTLHAP